MMLHSITLLFLAMDPAAGPPPSPPEHQAELAFPRSRAILLRAIEDRAFPGCAVAVGSTKRCLWQEALGFLDYSHQTPVQIDTWYDLASLTKVVGTTSVFMRLSAQGKVTVADPVGRTMPEFVEAASNEPEAGWRRGMTIKHLLTHTAGLAAWKPYFRRVRTYPTLIRAVLSTPLNAAPATRYCYSDLGFILLGELAGRLEGKPLTELERRYVFKPLGMNHTLRNPSPSRYSNIAPTEIPATQQRPWQGVVHDENARAGEGKTGHAGLFAPVGDLSRFASEILLGLEGLSRHFPQSVVIEFTRQHPILPSQHRGLGWAPAPNAIPRSLSPSAFGHTGFTGVSLWIDPERKLYLILLTNRIHPTRANQRISQVRQRFRAAVIEDWESLRQDRDKDMAKGP